MNKIQKKKRKEKEKEKKINLNNLARFLNRVKMLLFILESLN
jgi:hypothetical protein